MASLLLCVVCFVFALCASATAQEVQVCVSYGGALLQDAFINVNWNFSDDEVNITFEDNNGISSRIYNKTSAVGIPLSISLGQETITVTVCRLNNTLPCHPVIAVTSHIYDATFTRVNNTRIEFTCEVACRTPAITGCIVKLVDMNNGPNQPFGSVMLNAINGTDEEFSSRSITVSVDNVDPAVEYTSTATPTAIVNEVTLFLKDTNDIIPAVVQVTNTSDEMSTAMMATLTPSPTASDSSDMSSTDIISIPTIPASGTTSSSIASEAPTPSNSVTVGATDDDDDDDDFGYLPVIIAASCACVLLLIVAIILLIIIIRVKRRGSGSNLSSPSASKVNNYDDLGDVRYFPMLDSQNNVQKSQSPSDTQNQESHKKPQEYDFPVFTSVEQNPQVVASYNLLNVNDTTYDTPDGVLNPTSQSTDPLYDPVTLESAAQPNGVPQSPVEHYDKLVHSPTPQATNHFPPSIYDTLTDKNLRDHYEFPDKNDGNGTLEVKTELRRVASANGDEYTLPQLS